MNSNQTPLTMAEVEHRGRSGLAFDVDYLMERLDQDQALVIRKLVDYGLGLVSCGEGRDRLRYFLFNGSLIQRNYAALYFKRRGYTGLLDEAVQRGCIDEVQAYAE